MIWYTVGMGPAIRFTQIDGDFGVLVGGRGGWIINHRFVLGSRIPHGRLTGLKHAHNARQPRQPHRPDPPVFRFALPMVSEPVDDRRVGENPPLHGIGAHRGMIC